MFSALAENSGGLDGKLSQFIALAPVVEMGHVTNTMLAAASKVWHQLASTASALGQYEIRNPATDKALSKFCEDFSTVCTGITNFLNLKGSPYNDASKENIANSRPASSASLWQLVHYGQLINSGEFRKFDYASAAANKEHYGTATPPELNLHNIHLPVSLFVGQHDDLADPTDTANVRSKLNNVNHYEVYNGMDHMSFGIGKDMSFMKDVISQLKSSQDDDSSSSLFM